MRQAGLIAISLLLLSSDAQCAVDITAPELGRLFYSAERRGQLERQRQLNVLKVRSLEGETLTLDGVVTRSSGKSTVWINQRAQNEGEAEQTGVSVMPDTGRNGRARIVTGEAAAMELRVGESVNRATGEYNDRLGGGRVSVGKPR